MDTVFYFISLLFKRVEQHILYNDAYVMLPYAYWSSCDCRHVGLW